MAQMMLVVAKLMWTIGSMGFPFVSFSTWQKRSISRWMWLSILDLPTPRSLNWRMANRRCSFHSGPLEVATPASRHVVNLRNVGQK